MENEKLLEQFMALLRQELKALRPKEFLIVKEAAKLTRHSVGSLYNMVNQRKIPYLKPGGKLLFSYDDLIEWMESKAVRPVSDEPLIIGGKRIYIKI